MKRVGVGEHRMLVGVNRFTPPQFYPHWESVRGMPFRAMLRITEGPHSILFKFVGSWTLGTLCGIRVEHTEERRTVTKPVTDRFWSLSMNT